MTDEEKPLIDDDGDELRFGVGKAVSGPPNPHVAIARGPHDAKPLRIPFGVVPRFLHAVAQAAGTTLADIVENETLEEELVIRHKGVELYQTYKDLKGGVLSDNFVCTRPNCESDADDAFDVRDLPNIPADLEERYRSAFPDDLTRTLAYAIDQELIDADGLVLAEEQD